MKNSQKGFVIPIIVVIVVLLAIGGGAYIYTNSKVEAPVSIPAITNNVPIVATSTKSFIETEILHELTGSKIVVIRTDNEEYTRECIIKPQETHNLPDQYLTSSIMIMYIDKSGTTNILDQSNTCLYSFDSIIFSPDGKYVSFRTYGFEYSFYSLIDLETFINLNKDTYINFNSIKWSDDSSEAVIESNPNRWLVGKKGSFIFDANSKVFRTNY